MMGNMSIRKANFNDVLSKAILFLLNELEK